MPSEPDRPTRWRALAAGALDLAQQLSDPGAKEAMIVVAEQYTALAEGAERLTTRALVRVVPKTTWKSKAVDRLIIGMVGFLWGVLLGGVAAYWAPPAGDNLHSRKRAELCIERPPWRLPVRRLMGPDGPRREAQGTPSRTP